MIRLRCVEKLLGDDYKRNCHLHKSLTQAAAKRGKEPPVAEFPFMFLLMIRAVYNSDSGFGSVAAEPQLPVSTI
jgi:hypothetical protein